MSGAAIGRGCIIHWEKFRFADGETADKFLVILGAKTGSNYLAVKGTSKSHSRGFIAGCHAKDGYYHLPAGKEWFPKDTWLLLAEAVEIDPALLLKKAFERTVTIRGQLRTDIANAICNCLKQCPDVSGQQRALL